jgi:hypothetical protein
MKRHSRFLICVCIPALAGVLYAQNTAPEKVTVPLSDPSKPAVVKASLLDGGISVTAYDGKDVVIESRARDARGEGKPAEKSEGMRRLISPGAGLRVTEENNFVDIATSSFNKPVDLALQVPRNTSLKLSCINDGDINVSGVHGEIEVNNINGAVTLTNVSGSVVAHALNEDLVASLSEVTPNKPMSFSSLNGKIDVTLPAIIKANLVVKSDNGEIFSDFDIKLDPNQSKPVIEDSRSKGGKFKLSMDGAIRGTINGGGPEIQFKGFNGNIYIRKGK